MAEYFPRFQRIIVKCHIWQAARDGKIEVIRQRLQKLEKNPARRLKVINKADEDSTTPLHYAVRYGHVEVVKLLVEFGAGKPDFNEYFYLACCIAGISKSMQRVWILKTASDCEEMEKIRSSGRGWGKKQMNHFLHSPFSFFYSAVPSPLTSPHFLLTPGCSLARLLACLLERKRLLGYMSFIF